MRVAMNRKTNQDTPYFIFLCRYMAKGLYYLSECELSQRKRDIYSLNENKVEEK